MLDYGKIEIIEIKVRSMIRKLFGAAVMSCLLLLSLVSSALASSTGADSYSGIAGSTCALCHAGGTEPTVTMTGPALLAPGETGNYVLTVVSADVTTQPFSGMAAAVGNAQGIEIGAFLNLDSDLKVRPDQTAITHSAPKQMAADGTATFTFEYVAPSLEGTYTMYYVGNATNGNGNPGGDGAMAGTVDIVVSDSSEPTHVSLRSTTAEQSYAVLTLFVIVLGMGMSIVTPIVKRV